MDKKDFISKFQKARLCGTPIIAVSCFDAAATMEAIQKTELTASIIQWDIINGWRGRNNAGLEAMNSITTDPDDTINPTESLQLALRLPENSILFLQNPHHFFDRPEFLQALWNLRDKFKANFCSVVLISTSLTIPEQLQQDVLQFDEPLPTDEELLEIVDTLLESADITVEEETRQAALDAIRGLSSFPAEQSVAMCLKKSGIDIPNLWERKRALISGTPGLRVYSGEETFENIGGCDQIKRFMQGIIGGKEPPRVIVFIDEGEKMFAGAVGGASDSSGVSQDFLGTTLSYMEDNGCDGSIFVGPPGAAKSAIAKAMGKEAGIPTIILDLGGMKGGLVGKSEAQIRTAYKVISAVGGGQAFFIMTCNQMIDLPPELKRRFTSGIFYFDLPTKEERLVIWDIYLKKYKLDFDPTTVTFDEGWTGAEIRNCCRMAYRQNLGINESSKFIVPVAISSYEQIRLLRAQASNRYLSANSEGIYRQVIEDQKTSGRGHRKVDIESN